MHAEPTRAPIAGARPVPRTVFEVIFAVLVTYYWALQLIRGDSVEMVPSDFAYFLFVVPAAAFGIAGALYMLFTRPRLNNTGTLLTLFLLAIIGISLFRGDLRTIASMGLFGITLLVIFEVRPRISIDLVNLMFAASIFITTGLFFFEYSIYTFVPGIGNHPLWWRVSPLPSVAEGGLFAMTVFLLNLVFRGQRFRALMLVISGYFIIMTGSRTAIAGTVLAAGFALLRMNGKLVSRGAQITYAVIGVLLFVFAIMGSQLLLLLPFADNEILRSLIFREEEVGRFDVGNQVGTAAIRQWIFYQHIAAFQDNLWFGLGTFDLRQLNTGYGALDDRISGSEAFVTGLLARIGLSSLLLFSALFLVRQTSRQAPDLSVTAKLALFVSMISYGSFVNVYDIVFVLLVLAVAGCIDIPGRRASVGRASPQTPRQVSIQS